MIALLGIGVTASPCFLWEGLLMEKVKKHTVHKCPRFTQSELQQEYNYLQAERITNQLLEKGLITLAEYGRIMDLNRKTFPTLLASLLPAC